jgi:hypothetical protein
MQENSAMRFGENLPKEAMLMVRRFCLCLIAGLICCSCAPKRAVFFKAQAFPPKAKQPVRLFLAAPVDSLDLSPARDAIVRRTGDPAAAVQRAACVWNNGMTAVARRHAKDTEVVSDILGDHSPYPPTSQWVRYTADALGSPVFSLTDPAISSQLRNDGFDYAVVPQDLSLRAEEGYTGSIMATYPLSDSERRDLYFETPTAVVDIETNAVIWCGVVSSIRQELAVQSSMAWEEEAYDWLLDLLVVLGRKVSHPTTRFQPCK